MSTKKSIRSLKGAQRTQHKRYVSVRPKEPRAAPAKPRQFTRAQKRAYHSGMGYAVSFYGRGIHFQDPSLKKSFAAGYNSGIEKMRRKPAKYPKISAKE